MRAIVALIGLALIAIGPSARADGAFPDSMQVLLPPDRPTEILVATNFGLLVSEDDGATWDWVCEDVVGACARLYQLAAGSSGAIYAVTTVGLSRLTGAACTQDFASTLVANTRITDAFADPIDPAHLLAIGSVPSDGGSAIYDVLESRDSGASFGTQLFEAPPGTILTGVENARTDPRTIYLTATSGGQVAAPLVLRSTDGGTTFTSFDHSPDLADARLRLIAISAQDATKLFLRAIDLAASVDRLALSEDGGMTSQVTLSFPAQYEMTSFLEMSDGTILAVALQPGMTAACGVQNLTGNAPPSGHVSTDGGHSFQAWAGAPHARALGERGGALYAVGDNFLDGFALARSTDLGAHWTPLLKLEQIRGPLACQAAACASAWGALQTTLGLGDGGTAPPMNPSTGCGCSVGVAAAGAWPALLVALILFGARRHARRRRRCER